MAVESDAFRRLLRHFASSVTIISVRSGDELHGMTATAVASVSLTPPLLLACLYQPTRTHRLISESGAFAVNLLHQDQRELAERFAGRGPESVERFDGIAYGYQVTGAPILHDSLGYFDCRVVARHDGGDHSIFIGQVEAAGYGALGSPLCYYQGDYLYLSSAPACTQGGTEDMQQMMTMEGRIADFITQEYLQGDGRDLSQTLDLVEARILDSIGVLRLVDFLEGEFRLVLKAEDVFTLTSIANIAKLVRARTGL